MNLAGSTVVVTGAAGTIGSEVCRLLTASDHRGQIDRLVMVDLAETPLFYLEEELAYQAREAKMSLRAWPSAVADAFPHVVQNYSPDLIIHAAAMKHVGMCERHPAEAVLTNIAGTRQVLAAAAEVGAKVVTVSTDKAVQPTSVMGATKCLAEVMTLQAGQQVMRLVNVRGSQGSVEPLVRRQIQSHSPVTITDENMERFFMECDEAAGCILAVPGLSGSVYVPAEVRTVRIADMIRGIVKDATKGWAPGEIEIEVVGRRPGEKLQEAMLWPDEARGETVSHVTEVTGSRSEITESRVARLIRYAQEHDSVTTELLFDLVAHG